MTVCGEKVSGVCVAGKCPYFKRCHPVVWDKYGKIKPHTNEEWLKSLDTEQLAEWIVHIADDCTMQHECNLCNSWCDEKRVMEWLKQPHTTEVGK